MSGQGLAAAATVAIAFVVFALAASADEAFVRGVWACLSTPALAVVAWLVVRGAPSTTDRLAHLPALLAGAVAVCAIWLRVWSRPYPEESGIVPFFFNLLAFWWPALVAALVAIVLERLLGAPVPRFGERVLAALIAGVAGMLLFFVAGATWFRVVDRYALADEVQRAFSNDHAGPGSAVPFRHDRPRLAVDVDAPPSVFASTLETLQYGERLRTAAVRLTRRNDVSRVIVSARADGREVLRFEVTDHDRVAETQGRPTPSIDRSAFPGAGRLDDASLRRMVLPYVDHTASDPFAEWNRRFGAEVAGEEVHVRFDPPGALGIDTVGWYAAGFEAANAVVNEVARSFPEIVRFRVVVPGIDTVVDRGSITPGDYRLQRGLVPEAHVLTLHVSRADSAPVATFDPGAFAAAVVPGYQVAVLREGFVLPSAFTGFLFEGVRLEPGSIYVLSVRADGTARIVLETNEGDRFGPADLAPGGVVVLGPERVQNLGLTPRSVFPIPGR